MGLGERVELDARDLKIDTLANRYLLHCRQSNRSLGQSRQRFGQSEIEIAAPKAKRAHQPLALPRCALLRAGESGRDIGVKRLFARLVELVEGTGLAETLCELRHCRRCGICLRKQV